MKPLADVIPAKAGIRPNVRLGWIPAYAGMTVCWTTSYLSLNVMAAQAAIHDNYQCSVAFSITKICCVPSVAK